MIPYKQEPVIVKDKITGFKGQITGHADYITGCDQYLVQPPNKDGEWKDSHWFDEGRLEVIELATVGAEDLKSETGNGADSPAPAK